MAANWFVKDMALMSLKQVSKILSQSLSLKYGYTLSGYIWWFKDTQLIKYADSSWIYTKWLLFNVCQYTALSVMQLTNHSALKGTY